MSIQKKSLINTLKSAKKANVVKDEVTVSPATVSAVKALRPGVAARAPKISPRQMVARSAKSSAPRKQLRRPSPRIAG